MEMTHSLEKSSFPEVMGPEARLERAESVTGIPINMGDAGTLSLLFLVIPENP